MKLKRWLREYHELSYAEYKTLPEEQQWQLVDEFQSFNNQQNRAKQQHARSGWRSMTEEEKEHCREIQEKESLRYETSLKIGGIDERGNYTALHHRINEDW